MTTLDRSFDRAIFDAIDGGILVLGASAQVSYWNAWMVLASGKTEAEVLGKTLPDIFPDAQLGRLVSAAWSALTSNASTILTHSLNPSILPLRSRSGQALLHDITVTPVGNEVTTACLIFIADVTRATKRESYLREQQNARYDAVVARAADVIMTVDEEGRIQFANQAAISQLQYSESELIGMEAASLYDNREEWLSVLQRAIDDSETIQPRELIARRKDGSTSYLEASASRWKIGARALVTVILRDVNERRAKDEALRASEQQARDAATALSDLNQTLEQRVQRRTSQLMEAEEALRHSQKMEAIGNLTGGIAHDFNNLLQVISGNLHLIKREVKGNPEGEKRVRNALDGVARSAKLSSQLLAFARRQPLAPRVIDLGRFIDDMEDILSKAVGEGVKVEITNGPGPLNTLVDPGNLENALINLAVNARDAMGSHGWLRIRVENLHLDAEMTEIPEEVASGEYVRITLTDTGSGMSPEVLQKAFEPFFTTKPEGHGTGLGLSMVYGFVKQSGGYVHIVSETGRGTTIELYLPRSLQPEDRRVTLETGAILGGTETILLAEDDDSVRETVAALLKDLGYRVVQARDAEVALGILQSGIPIDLLLTDVIMPGPMKSTDLARKGRELNPWLPVLFTSGYPEKALVQFDRQNEQFDLLSKPYSRETLARTLRLVLAKAAAGSSALAVHSDASMEFKDRD